MTTTHPHPTAAPGHPDHRGHDHHAHDHHQHEHDVHDHQLSGESYPHVQGGPTVLDIGGDIGAMIVTLNPDAAGTELHLRSAHQPPISIHTGVWRRDSGERSTTTAVFAELLEGDYWVLDSAGNDVRQVEIRGGALTSIDLRNAAATASAPAES